MSRRRQRKALSEHAHPRTLRGNDLDLGRGGVDVPYPPLDPVPAVVDRQDVVQRQRARGVLLDLADRVTLAQGVADQLQAPGQCGAAVLGQAVGARTDDEVDDLLPLPAGKAGQPVAEQGREVDGVPARASDKEQRVPATWTSRSPFGTVAVDRVRETGRRMSSRRPSPFPPALGPSSTAALTGCPPAEALTAAAGRRRPGRGLRPGAICG